MGKYLPWNERTRHFEAEPSPNLPFLVFNSPDVLDFAVTGLAHPETGEKADEEDLRPCKDEQCCWK